MSQFKRALLWAALIAVILLVLLSVYGAFLGAERARAFFNSLPLAVYWFALIALLVAGFIAFRRLLQIPSLLLMHLGSILVLLGALWGSNGGHALAKRIFGVDKIPEGQMGILEQTQENRVLLADSNSTRALPFFVRLKDLRMEYTRRDTCSSVRHRPELALPAGQDNRCRWAGSLAPLPSDAFENFKMDLDGRVCRHDVPGGSNPALEVTVEAGKAPEEYVFERLPGHGNPKDPLKMSYNRMVRDYVSELEIVQDGRVVAAKNIEVNHPLHYGGYQFYQHSYGEDKLVDYTVLMAVSDSGLDLVYGGYLMLGAGVFWHFWGRRAWRGCGPPDNRSRSGATRIAGCRMAIKYTIQELSSTSP
jgi:hypothetical protein